MSDVEEEYHVPLVDQRVFGAGVNRKRIAFIPASNGDGVPPQSVSIKPNLADKYLSIVLPKESSSNNPTSAPSEGEASSVSGTTVCPICKQPVSVSADNIAINTHESSIAHQVCLEHSHPPSHLDRDHVGLRYLKEYGWDPDGRTGLGAKAEGIRIPVKTKAKHDTIGLREFENDDDVNSKTKKVSLKPKKEPVVMLDAGKVRKQEAEKKRRAEKLRTTIYGPDLEQYLGPGG